MIEQVQTPHGPVEVWTREGKVYSRPSRGTPWKPNPYARKEYLIDALESGIYRG